MTFMGRAAGHRLRRAREAGDHRGAVLAVLPAVAVLALLLGRVVAEPLALAVLPDLPAPLLTALGAAALLGPALALLLLLRLDLPTPVRLGRGRLAAAWVAMLLLASNAVWAAGLRRASPERQEARLGGAWERAEPFLVGTGGALLLVVAGALVLWWWRRRHRALRARGNVTRR